MALSAQAIAEKVAQKCFTLRGNRSEAHLTRRELAMWCQAAVQISLDLQQKQAIVTNGN